MKTFLKTVIYVVAGLLVFGVVAGLFVTSTPGENLLRDWIEKKVSEDLGIRLHIGTFETNLWSHVRLDTVSLVQLDINQSDTLLYVSRARISYSLPRLLAGNINLKELTADSVFIRFDLDSSGRSGIPLIDDRPVDTAEEPDSATSFSVDTIIVDQVGLDFSYARIPLALRMLSGKLEASAGPDGSVRAGFTTGSLDVQYDTIQFDVQFLEALASYDSGRWTLSTCELVSDGLKLSAHGNVVSEPTNALDLKATISGSFLDKNSSMTQLLASFGVGADTILVWAHATGEINAPTVDFSVLAKEVIYGKMAAPEIYLAGSLDEAFLKIDSLSADLFQGRLAGVAKLGLDSAATSTIRLRAGDMDIGAIWPILYDDMSPFLGAVSGDLEAAGRIVDPYSWSADMNFSTRSLKYGDQRIPDLQITASALRSNGQFSLVHGEDRIEADFNFANDSLVCNLNLKIPEVGTLARFLDVQGLTGSLIGTALVQGPLDNPEAQVSVAGSRISYRGFPVDTLSANAVYRDGRLSIRDLLGTGELDSIDPNNPPFQIDSLSGSLWYVCRGSGLVDSLNANITVAVGHPGLGSIHADTISLKAELNGTMLTVSEAILEKDDLEAQATAKLDVREMSGEFRALLKSAEDHRLVDSGQTVPLEPYGTVSGEFRQEDESNLIVSTRVRNLQLGLVPAAMEDTTSLGGLLNCDMKFRGSVQDPQLELTAQVSDFSINDYHAESISGGASLSRSALLLDSLTVNTLGQVLRVSGLLPLSVSDSGTLRIDTLGPVRAELNTTDFDLAGLSDMASPASEISGLVSASLELYGTVNNPHLQGWLTVARGHYQSTAESVPIDNIDLLIRIADSVATIERGQAALMEQLLQLDGSRFVLRPGRVEVRLSLMAGKLGALTVDGEIADKTVNLTIAADNLDISVAQPVLDQVDSLSGVLAGHLTVTGSTTLPYYDGAISLVGVNAVFPRNGIRMSDGHSSLSLHRNHVILDSLSVLINGGSLTARGMFDYDSAGPTNMDMAFQASGISLSEPEYYDLNIDTAQIRWDGLDGTYTISGDVILGDARLTAGFRPNSILPWVSTLESVDMELPDLVARSRLDLRIRQSDNLWIDNNLARVRMHAELGIIGTPLRPNLTGLIRVEEGYLIYLDRRFEVEEGVVFFTDPVKFNPEINLAASTEVTVYQRTTPVPYIVSIKASGPLDQLQYGLYSEPELDKSDIVAVLTLGATRSELTSRGNGNGQGGLADVLRDRAAMLTSQRVSGYLSRRASSLFGFDEFSISGNLFQLDENWGPSLVASKRLTGRLNLTYSTTVGHINDQSVRLGYRLTPHVSLQGETDQQGRAGIDLKYGFTFK